MSELKTVATLAELPDGGVIRRDYNGTEVAIFRKGEDLYAINAQCPHRGGPLDEADLENGTVVVCPWHGWRFDITTGKSPSPPAQVSCFTVERDGDSILLGPAK